MTAGVVVLVLVGVVEIGVAAALLWWSRQMRRRPAPVDPAPRRASPHHPLIEIEILNAPELAARESWAARYLGGFFPHTVGREVGVQAAAQLAAGLDEQGVRADVRIVGAIDAAAP